MKSKSAHVSGTSSAVLALAAALAALPVWPDEPSPSGLWKNADDVIGKPRALSRQHG